MRKEITKEKALERLEALCNRSEQCEFDLNRKLVNWGVSPSDREEILNSLKADRYLDDERYARSFAGDKARFSYWGPQKIRMELIKKRIPAGKISEALQHVESKVWREGLLKNAASKARSLDLLGEEGWENGQKLYRYLMSRGFPSSAASKAVAYMRKLMKESADREE